MRGSPIRMAAALAFCAAAFGAMAQRHEKQQAVLKSGGFLPNEPTSGAFNYRGGPGNRAHQRAALKRRNVLRHRKACRG
jgi:Spy/CpxP family protein refolding chaperone